MVAFADEIRQLSIQPIANAKLRETSITLGDSYRLKQSPCGHSGEPGCQNAADLAKHRRQNVSAGQGCHQVDDRTLPPVGGDVGGFPPTSPGRLLTMVRQTP